MHYGEINSTWTYIVHDLFTLVSLVYLKMYCINGRVKFLKMRKGLFCLMNSSRAKLYFALQWDKDNFQYKTIYNSNCTM